MYNHFVNLISHFVNGMFEFVKRKQPLLTKRKGVVLN